MTVDETYAAYAQQLAAAVEDMFTEPPAPPPTPDELDDADVRTLLRAARGW